MDDEVEALARAMRLAEGSDLAKARGDLVRAFELAIEARDEPRAVGVAAAIAAAIAATDEAVREAMVRRARAAAVRRSEPANEGIVLEAIGALDEAAAAYERGSAWRRAATIHRRRGDVARAGRALERQVREDPTDARSRIDLAALLVETGRGEAALRAIRELDGAEVAALRRRAEASMGLRESEAAAAEAPRPHEEGLLFGRYEVVREVASTASSRVLEARDRLAADRARVALKIFTGASQVGAGRDALARFRREMDVLAHVDAPTVLRARAMLPEGPTIVLPWMAGGSVADLRAKGPISPRRAAEIVGRVLEALDAAHRRGVIHRDVKPANVLLDDVGGAYLADFGVAHLGDASATATAGLLGTLKYMAPEQKMGAPATTKSDVYAAAVVFAELLGLSGEPLRLEPLPIEAAALFRDMLADAPSDRPDAAAARARLAALRWPDELALAREEAPRSSLPPPSARFTDEGAGALRDLVLEREETLVAPHDPRAPLACVLAVVMDPALPSVLGVDRSGSLRVERCTGAAVEGLDDEERAAIARALAAIHARGVIHGDVARSIVRSGRGVVLAFPERANEGADAGADRAALASIPQSSNANVSSFARSPTTRA